MVTVDSTQETKPSDQDDLRSSIRDDDVVLPSMPPQRLDR
jgi:hypothetical protein